MAIRNRKLHSGSYRLNTIVLGCLLLLTVLTVLLSRIDFGLFDVAVTIVVAAVKSFLIIYYFMHLKYEKTYFCGLVLLCFFLLAIAIGMTFFDIGWRY
ncbi:MAG: cytochrome C oxidase subunit IV family protein [Desulfovibrionales bacterium]|nr:cytochrome C oxidase subunit IV family protein [Desulfovibrionales bacterium]